MYLNFYHLRKEPFQITPDPEFLFLSPSHKEALASIIYGIEQRKGFVAIIGEVGVGKTTLLRSYLEEVDRKPLKIVYIFNSNVSFRGLLKTVHQELGLTAEADDAYEMVNRLHRWLIDEYKKGNNVVLIIDEAQNMPTETLENLRMLSNLETSKDKLMQIVLVGQPELEHKLNQKELRQLRQRIAVKATISPLTKEECMKYVRHRLSKVATKEAPVFTTEAMKQIVRKSQGVPRVINILCDNSLITGFGYQKRRIGSRIVKEVVADFEGRRRPGFWRWGLAVFVLLLLLAGIFWMYRHSESPPWGSVRLQSSRIG